MPPPGTPKKVISKDDILRAMRYTNSVKSAARYLNVTFQTLKPYMQMYRVDEDDITSPTLFDQHKNRSGVGIVKHMTSYRGLSNVQKLFTTGLGWENVDINKIKRAGIEFGYLREECYTCGYNTQRLIDCKVPLLLNFKDGNKSNFLMDNLEMLCYNCMFVYGNLGKGEDVFTEDQVEYIETDKNIKTHSPKIEIDADLLANMEALGLSF